MSAWRRKAIALFPEHRADLDSAEYRLHDLFLDLLIDVQRAHGAAADDSEARSTLQRVHGFAEWCLRHGGELWNQAAIGFYEDLLNGSGVPWDMIVPWISPYAAEQIEQTWALGVSGERAPRFRELLRQRHQEEYHTHVAATGEIDDL
jgi:hypothetical protein